jgi:uncharacterized protein (TIGR03000 family)
MVIRRFGPPLLASALLLACAADRAAAQIILGNGRVVIGGPVDFSTSTGQGNYPGSDGFVPGYGYYPNGWRDSGIDLSLVRPWPHAAYMPPPFHREFAPAPPPPAEPTLALPPGAALLVVRVPADAEVWFGGDPTAQRGRTRLFTTPPLEAGRDWTYALRVRWTDAGKPVERSQTIHVRPGDKLLMDYTAAEALPPPRDFRGP